MTPIDFSSESQRALHLRMMDGRRLDHVSLIAAFVPETNYGVAWHSVIDFRGGSRLRHTIRQLVYVVTFNDHKTGGEV